MSEKLFIIGDVHGEYTMLERLLQHWKPEEEKLVFLGDLGDRGPDPKSCFLKVFDLVKSGQAVCVTGNHEDMLLRWLANPKSEMNIYLHNGGQTTLESFFYPGVFKDLSPKEMAEQFKKSYPDLLAFLKTLPLYYENDFCICVHAGVNLDIDDWRKSSRHDFIWIREDFYAREKKLDKLVVFGHTPLPYVHGTTHFWNGKGKLNIDGGAAYGGSLHGVVLSENGIEADYQIFNPKYDLF